MSYHHWGLCKIESMSILLVVFTAEHLDRVNFQTSEKAAAQKEQGLALHEKVVSGLCDEEIYKIELPANRYDLLCIEGLSRALRIFKNE